MCSGNTAIFIKINKLYLEITLYNKLQYNEEKISMKKFLITTAITAVLALSLIGCGSSSNEINAKSLPASGAKTFISSEEDFVSLFTEIAMDLESDPGIMILAEAAEDIDPDNLSPNLLDIFEKEEERAEDYLEKIMSDGKDGFAQSGKINYAIDRKIGTIKGLPEGISFAIPTSKAKADISLSKNGKGTATGSYDTSANITFDAVKLLGKEDAASCIVKGLALNMGSKADVKVNILADELEDDDDFTDFLYYINDGNAKVNASVTMDVGYSLCAPSGLGGKIILKLKVTLDNTFTKDSLENIEDLFDSIIYGYEPSAEELASLPVIFEVSGKIYDDSGKVTYTTEDAKYSLSELYEEALPLLELLEEYL